MTLGVIADIHGNDAALRVVLEEFARRGISEVIFLGDLVGYYPFVKTSLEMLASFRVTSVRGNHDQVALDCLEAGTLPSEAYRRKYGSALGRTLAKEDPEVVGFLRSLLPEQEVAIASRKLRLCHGAPWDVLNGRVYPDFQEWEKFAALPVDAVLCGHTHYPTLKFCGTVLVLNPGSVGQARQRGGGGRACAALLDVPTMAASLLEIPYDPAAIIADARVHDPDLPYLTQVLQR